MDPLSNLPKDLSISQDQNIQTHDKSDYILNLPDELLQIIFFDSPYTQAMASLINKRIYQLTSSNPNEAIKILTQCKSPATFKLDEKDPDLTIVDLDTSKGEVAGFSKTTKHGYKEFFCENIYTHYKIKAEHVPYLSFVGFFKDHLYCISADEGIGCLDNKGQWIFLGRSGRGNVNQVMIANDNKRIAYTLGEGTSICLLDTTNLESILSKTKLENISYLLGKNNLENSIDLRNISMGIRNIPRDIYLPKEMDGSSTVNLQLCTGLAFAGNLLIAAYQTPNELKIYDMQGNLIKQLTHEGVNSLHRKPRSATPQMVVVTENALVVLYSLSPYTTMDGLSHYKSYLVSYDLTTFKPIYVIERTFDARGEAVNAFGIKSMHHNGTKLYVFDGAFQVYDSQGKHIKTFAVDTDAISFQGDYMAIGVKKDDGSYAVEIWKNDEELIHTFHTSQPVNKLVLELKEKIQLTVGLKGGTIEVWNPGIEVQHYMEEVKKLRIQEKKLEQEEKNASQVSSTGIVSRLWNKLWGSSKK